MVSEAISSGQKIVSIAGTQDALDKLPACDAEIIKTDDGVFSYISDTKTPQGVLAVLKMPVAPLAPPKKNCAVLDGVADPGNLGTIIRTCAALGMEDVYLCECADAFSPKSVRSSMSGIYSVRVHEADRIQVAKAVENCTVIVADMGGENLFKCEIKGTYAIIIGNEANGVSDFFRARANKTIGIPMAGNVESLNAAVSFAVIAYTLANKN